MKTKDTHGDFSFLIKVKSKVNGQAYKLYPFNVELQTALVELYKMEEERTPCGAV